MKVNVRKKILGANEQFAFENSRLLAEKNVLCMNLISSPGSGKTSILVRTIDRMKGKLQLGVIEGDVQTDLDARKIAGTGAPVVQIETKGACHLSAAQVNHALRKLPLDDLDVVIIENVGNLVCPSAFELGEHSKVVVLSVAEGDDKPAKYPAIFAKSRVVLVNKIDLLTAGGVDFDIDRAAADARKLNSNIRILPVSAKTGEGFEQWQEVLLEAFETLKS